MIEVIYVNTEGIDTSVIYNLLELFPTEMKNEILKYRNHNDRCCRVLGKLIVAKYFSESDIGFDWTKWCRSTNGKPYYQGREKFNISHSGKYAAVAFSSQEVGLDIEMVTGFDIKSVSDHFHPDEIDSINNCADPTEFFFRLWTRKEAYLKARGIGILNGVHNESCLSNVVDNGITWYLHSLRVIPNYFISVCTQLPDCDINVREILHEQLCGYFNN